MKIMVKPKLEELIIVVIEETFLSGTTNGMGMSQISISGMAGPSCEGLGRWHQGIYFARTSAIATFHL